MHLEITMRFITHRNSIRHFTTKLPIRGDHFDRSLIPSLVEATWKQKHLALQMTSSCTIEHVESNACLISCDHIYCTNS